MNLGTAVIEFGTFRQKLQHQTSMNICTLTGKYAEIWTRQPDGRFLLTTQAWNYNHAINFADQLVLNEVPVHHVALQGHVPVNTALAFDLAAYNRLQKMVVTEHNPELWAMFYTDEYLLL